MPSKESLIGAQSPLVEFNGELSDEEELKYKQGLPYTFTIEEFAQSMPATLMISPVLLQKFNTKEYPDSFTRWLFAHELTHLKLHHTLFPTLLTSCNGIRRHNNIFTLNTAENKMLNQNNANELLQSKEYKNYLQAIELQADLLPLANNRVLTDELVAIFSSIHNSPRTDIYLSIPQLSLFGKAIQQCWKQESRIELKKIILHE